MTTAIILASGSGSRMNLDFNKVFAKLNNKPVLFYSLNTFENCDLVDKIIITSKKLEINKIEKLIKKYKFKKIIKIVAGGKTRMQSAQNGLNAEKIADQDIVLVHDAARPFISEGIIKQIIKAAQKNIGAVAGVMPKDTISEIDKNNFIINTPLRNNLASLQTPFGAKFKLIKKARELAARKNYLNQEGLEDGAIMAMAGEKVKIITSEYTNLKITTPEDLATARNIILSSSRRRGSSS